MAGLAMLSKSRKSRSEDSTPIPGLWRRKSTDSSFAYDALRIAIGPGVLAAYYYLSRRFVEAYFGELGIPPTLLDFDFADYLFAAGNTLTFVFLLLTGYVFTTAIWNIMHANSSVKTKNGSSLKTWLIILWAFIAAVLLVSSAIIAQMSNPFKESETIFFLLTALGLPMSAYLLSDRSFQSMLSNNRPVFVLTILVGGLAMAGFLVLGPEAWGKATAESDGRTGNAAEEFYKIGFTASERIGPDSMIWTQTESGNWQSDSYLLLLHSRDLYWVRDMTNGDIVFGVSSGEIKGLTLIRPG